MYYEALVVPCAYSTSKHTVTSQWPSSCPQATLLQGHMPRKCWGWPHLLPWTAPQAPCQPTIYGDTIFGAMHQSWLKDSSKCSWIRFTAGLQLFFNLSTPSSAPLHNWLITESVAMVKIQQSTVAQLNPHPRSVERLHCHWNQQSLQYQQRLLRRSTPTTLTLSPWTSSQVKWCLLPSLS